MPSAYVGYLIAGILAVVVGGLWAYTKFVYKRGGTEREFKLALDRNTESNKELTGVVGKVVEKLNEHDKRLDHAEWRLERLEAAPNVSVNVAPHRDPGTAG